jgi:hypothetical protein
MATCFKNVDRSCPVAELQDENVLFISRDLDKSLFDLLNRTSPAPKFITIKKNKLKNFIISDLMPKFIQYKEKEVKDFYEEQLERLDSQMISELSQAGIHILKYKERNVGEVPYQYYGKFKNYRFTRAWNYWVVRGTTSPSLAKKIYSDPLGKLYIRVNGDAGAPAPSEKHDVTSYHIDTQEGLIRFVELCVQ